jgi:hypothetical protein
MVPDAQRHRQARALPRQPANRPTRGSNAQRLTRTRLFLETARYVIV